MFTLKSLILVSGLMVVFGCALSPAADVVVTIAGNGTASSTGDGGAASSATVNIPLLIAKDTAGNLYFTEYGANKIRKIDTAGVISTVAGTGTAGYSGDGGPATAAQLNRPVGIDVDSAGHVYFSEQGNHVIRKITPAGIISTIAGTGSAGFSGDSGLATAAQLNSPAALRLDLSGNILFSDLNNNRVRMINLGTNIITTLAGNGTAGFFGDGGPATSAQVNAPGDITVASNGDILFVDGINERIRKVSGGNISTIAGTGTAGFSGDNGLASAATFRFQNGSSINGGLAFDAAGNLFVADFYNYRVRRIDVATTNITTVLGTGSPTFNGDGQAPLSTAVSALGLLPGNGGAMTFVDADLNRIRKILLNPAAPTSASISATFLDSATNTRFETRSVKSGTVVTFTGTGTDPNNIPLMFSWDFGDGSGTQTGNPITHTFSLSTGETTYTVSATGSHGNGSVNASSIQMTVSAPASGGVANVGQTGSTVTNPLLNLTTRIAKSDGGVIELDVGGSAIGRSPFTVNTEFDGLAGRVANRMGFRPVQRFATAGTFVATHRATDAGTNQEIGKVRRTVAVSTRELGASSVTPPSSTAWELTTLSGKFRFAAADSRATDKPDLVTYTGSVELPAGLSLAANLPVSVGIGNIIDSLQVTPKGKALLPSTLARIKKLQIKFPKLAKDTTTTVAGQKAKVTVSLSAANLSAAGFDTEGITASVRSDETALKTVSRSIQVALVLGDVAYENLAPVQFKLAPKMDSGSIMGRSAK